MDESNKGAPFLMKQCDVGDIPAHTGFNAPSTPNCVQTINPSVETHLWIITSALNGATNEDIFFRPSPKGPVMSFTVYQPLPNGKRKVLKSSDPTP